MDIRYYRKMKNINRLSMMFINRPYNLIEHQWMTGILFKHFAELEEIPFDMKVFDLVLKHDSLESETSDLPFPIKNFSHKTKEAWNIIESEVITKNYELERYSDENIKKGMTPVQFDLFKACDILDLLIFVREEISIGNKSKDILHVEENCIKILDSIETKFNHITKFLSEYEF